MQHLHSSHNTIGCNLPSQLQDSPTATLLAATHTLSYNTSPLQLLHLNSLECHHSLALVGKKHNPHFLNCATHWKLKLSSSSFQATTMASPRASTLLCKALFLPEAPLPFLSQTQRSICFPVAIVQLQRPSISHALVSSTSSWVLFVSLTFILPQFLFLRFLQQCSLSLQCSIFYNAFLPTLHIHAYHSWAV